MAKMTILDTETNVQMQNMERFYKNASKYVPEFPLLINVPRKKLIIRLLIYWVSLFFAALFSFNFFWMVTMIAFAVLVHKLYIFSSVWRVYGYSKIFLWVPCIVIVFIGLLDPTRMLLFDLFRYILRI